MVLLTSTTNGNILHEDFFGGIGLIVFGVIGLKYLKVLFLPATLEGAKKRAEKHLSNPIELNRYSNETSTNIAEIRNDISIGKKLAYEYRGFIFVENDC